MKPSIRDLQRQTTDLQKMSTIYSAVLGLMIVLLLTAVSEASIIGDKFSKESVTRQTGGEIIYAQNFSPATKVSVLLEALLTEKSASKLQVTSIKLITGERSYIEVVNSNNAFFLTHDEPYYSEEFSYYSTFISGVEITAESWGDYQGVVGELTAEVEEVDSVIVDPVIEDPVAQDSVSLDPYYPPTSPTVTEPVVVTQPTISCQSDYYKAKDELYTCNDEAGLLSGQVNDAEKKVYRLRLALEAMNAPLNACLSDLEYAKSDLHKAKSRVDGLKSKERNLSQKVYSQKRLLSKLNKIKGKSKFKCDLVDRHDTKIMGEMKPTRIKALFNVIKKCGINQCGKKRFKKTKFFCNFEFSHSDVDSYSDILTKISIEKRAADRLESLIGRTEKPKMGYKKKR